MNLRNFHLIDILSFTDAFEAWPGYSVESDVVALGFSLDDRAIAINSEANFSRSLVTFTREDYSHTY